MELSWGSAWGPLGPSIATAVLVVVGLTIVIAVVNRRFQRQHKELDLRDDRFRVLIEQSGDAIAVLDARGRVTFATGAMEAVLGYRPEELLGRSVFKFLTPDGDLLHRDQVRRLREFPDEVVQMEGGFQRKDGSWRIARASLINRVRHPAVGGLVLTFRDATEQVHLEEQLRLGQRLEAVGQLAGGIAHDFNNLLTTISGNVDLLLEEGVDESTSRQGLQEIRHAADRAAGLTRQLLAFGRRQVLQPRVLNLNKVVSTVSERLSRTVLGQKIQLNLDLAADLGGVTADPQQIEQVILALVKNANTALPDGGHISIATGNATFDEPHIRATGTLAPGDYVLLAVHDSGIGMTAETVKHIFDPFFTSQGEEKGTGLGLAMVHGIVEQSNGQILVYSEPGLGTSFKIFLPRTGIRPGTAEHRVPQRSPQGRERVLIAEDELSVQRLTRKILERQGYQVLVASDGAEALELAEATEHAIDLLVTDVIMPRMGGRELADRIATSHPEARILFVSGYSNQAISRQGILEPGFAFLEKPFTADSLADKVREVLDGGAKADSAA